jgi:prepilin-type N-terminal cleavage/methylation domain-containing protein
MGGSMKIILELLKRKVRRMRLNQSARGFTTIELMVALTCVAILAVAATPTIRHYMHMVHLRQAAYQISGDLYSVRTQAVKVAANCSITFNFSNNMYTVSIPAANPIRVMDLKTWGDVTFRANPDPGGVPADAFSPTISFNSRGLSALVPPVTTQVYLTNQDGYVFRVQVTATGAVSTRLWNSNNNTWRR